MDVAAPSPSGVWVDSKGRDVVGDNQRAPYYIFQVLLVLYIAGFVGHLTLVQNATVTHTYTYQNTVGTLYSERESSFYWYALMFSTCRIFLFITVCSLITYRKTSCCGRRGNHGCAGFWTGLLVALIVIDVVVLAILGSFFHGCNVPGYAGNPCNDERYCHVPEVYNNDDSGCTYKTPWSPPVALSELRRHPDFLWLFATSVVFVAVELVFLLVPLALWVRGGGNGSRSKKKKNDDVYEDDDDVDEKRFTYDVLGASATTPPTSFGDPKQPSRRRRQQPERKSKK